MTERAHCLILDNLAEYMSYEEDAANIQQILDQKLEEDIELQLDPLQSQLGNYRPMLFDLLDENCTLPDDAKFSLSFRARSHTLDDSQFERYFEVSTIFFALRHAHYAM